MKILLVEDDTFMSCPLAKMLAANHYTIALAADGQTGLEQAIAVECDLILLDLQCPNLDGIHLCRQLRWQGYHKPILLLTAKNSNADIATALDAGVDDLCDQALYFRRIAGITQVPLYRRQSFWRNPLQIHPRVSGSP